jgi:hypothetical protein
MTKTTTATELKRLEKQLELLKEQKDRDVMKTSAAIKEYVNLIRSFKFVIFLPQFSKFSFPNVF